MYRPVTVVCMVLPVVCTEGYTYQGVLGGIYTRRRRGTYIHQEGYLHTRGGGYPHTRRDTYPQEKAPFPPLKAGLYLPG